MICKEYGGGIKAFEYLLTEAPAMVVEVAFYAIQRRYQMENLHTFDKEEWPRFSDLIDYRSKMPRDPDFYRPNDYFLALGEWLHDKTEQRKINAMRDREAASSKK